MKRHTESQEDTSNLLESGEKPNDEIPSEGGCRDRSGGQHEIPLSALIVMRVHTSRHDDRVLKVKG
jgi:hypothetical protein